MKTPDAPGAFAGLLEEQFRKRQAMAELLSIGIFLGATVLIFGVLLSTDQFRGLHSFTAMRIWFGGFFGLMILMALVLRSGLWHPVLPYANTALQITLLSVFLAAAAGEKGPTMALSSALPMLYCLVISITAFRLNPWLSFFAGVLAAGEFSAVYAGFLRPQITPEILETAPTMGWPAMYARIVVLLAVGTACALAARSLRGQIRKNAKDQDRIELLERTFGRLVAPEVARQILEDENWMQPARRDAVVMFADLRGFTNYAENRSPEDVANFLNRCWTVAADVVERHGGVINKYLGDGFLAIFGVPMALEDAEQAAVQTASDLQKELASIVDPEGLALCVGVHSGPLIVGGIGSESRCEFTVIGTTVNLASRIESLNRPLDTRCLATQPIADKIAETWNVKGHGAQRVKGIAEGVEVFELLQKKPPE